MKKTIFLVLCTMAVAIWHGCKSEEETLSGSIYGVVTDKATGEPISAAGVELSPSGYHTVTGTEGQFEFRELTPGSYTLLVTKTGYLDYLSRAIEVAPSQAAKGDVQIEQLPPALKVVDDNRQEISELDYGSAEADVARSFNIFNDGTETLEWQITRTADWITDISKEEGVLKPGATQSLVMIIDRTLLKEGANSTTVHILSNNGSKQLTVKVVNGHVSATLNTLAVTNLKTTSATFNGEILTEGSPSYSERGFVYSLTTMPTLETTIRKITSLVTKENKYSANVSGLQKGQTYYVRAYAINSGKAAYSTNEISFTPDAVLPVVSTFNITEKRIGDGMASLGGNIMDAGDPSYTERGFVYGIMHNPTVDSDTKVLVSGTGTGEYNANVSGLNMGTIYYVRAYATNEKGTSYGEDVMLDMTPVMPEVLTGEFEFKSGGTVIFNGSITNIGDPAYTERGFVYGTMLVPSLDNGAVKVVSEGTIAGAFNAEIANLPENGTYNVRAYAITPVGTVYGEIKTIDSEMRQYYALPTFTHDGHVYRVYPDLGPMNWLQAIQICVDLSFGGYNDWILPTKEILSSMYIAKNSIGGFNTASSTSYSNPSYYWSSSESKNGYSWYQSFNNGQQGTSPTYTTRRYRVRPVRLEE